MSSTSEKLELALVVAKGVAEVGTLVWRGDERSSESAPAAWQRIYGEEPGRPEWTIETQAMVVRCYAGRRFMFTFLDGRPSEIRVLPGGDTSGEPLIAQVIAKAGEGIGSLIASVFGLPTKKG